ncbi:hypothetical protein Tco_0371251 [Tanacetum coccineum]
MINTPYPEKPNTFVESKFPAITLIDEISFEKTLSCEPTVSSLDNEVDFRISFDDSDDEDHMVIFDKNSLSYKIIYVNSLKTNSENDNEKVNMPLLPSLEPMVSCFDDLDFFIDFENEFPAIVHNDALTPKSNLSIESTLCPQHIDDFDLKNETSLFEYDEKEKKCFYTNADIANFEERLERLERIHDRDTHRVQVVDFQGMLELMRDVLVSRMLMEHHDDGGVVVFTSRAWRRLHYPVFASRSQETYELEAVYCSFGITYGGGDGVPQSISTDGDFLRPPPSYTLIRDPVLRLCHRMMAHSIAGRSQAPKKICKEIDYTWAWVALGPERQPDVAAGTPGAAEDALAVDEGDHAVPAPIQAPPPPSATARTMPQRMAILEEDVHEIHGALAEQREMISVMAMDFSKFTVWAASGIAQLLDFVRVTYTSYYETNVPYQRRVRRRTDGASTSAAQQDQ